jgi:hypothetical protein
VWGWNRPHCLYHEVKKKRRKRGHQHCYQCFRYLLRMSKSDEGLYWYVLPKVARPRIKLTAVFVSPICSDIHSDSMHSFYLKRSMYLNGCLSVYAKTGNRKPIWRLTHKRLMLSTCKILSSHAHTSVTQLLRRSAQSTHALLIYNLCQKHQSWITKTDAHTNVKSSFENSCHSCKKWFEFTCSEFCIRLR